MDDSGSLISMGPLVGILSQIVTWTGFVIVLGILKNFVTHGMSIFLAEFLFKQCNIKQQAKLTRVLANGDVILEELKSMKKAQEATESV